MQQSLGLNGTSRRYPSAFEESWQQYPRRDGPTSKADTFRQWQRRLLEGYEAREIHEGVVAYRQHCDRTGKTGTAYVMQAERFVGKGLHFLSDYTQPARVLPRNIWKPPVVEPADVPPGYLTSLLRKWLGRKP